ncbi:STAS domain-containing protein [Streptomyces minutiscleroticus]|uniref:STAS domain-containing protein n=1 Tax=Streptomyces minutiscleroticus TaxID=68238 RepID=A0A918KLM2_9ACTN|nr:STAS domain-containing protein [Streptomyces minutiscleroticus]GGX66330.1 hypothetical protein GCM10010358_20940 [Streptomyces minutiscleroticus]
MPQTPESQLIIHRAGSDDHTVQVRMAGLLTLDGVWQLTEMVAELSLHTDDQCDVSLDLSEISYCDRNSLFTLLGMCMTMRGLGVDITITDLSTTVRIQVDLAGLEKHLPIGDG